VTSVPARSDPSDETAGPSRRVIAAFRRPEVLLVASIDAVGIARLPRLFHEAGYRVSVLASPRLAVLRSRYVSQRIVTARGVELLVSELGKMLDSGDAQGKWIVLCDEIVMRHVASLPDAERYAAAFPVPFADRHVALSNVRFMYRAAACEMAVPEFEICSGEAEGRAAAGRIGYPVMAKLDYGMTGSGVRLLEGEEDWDEIGLSLEGDFLVQKYVAGETGTTNILFDHGVPVSWFSFYVRHNWPNRFCASAGGEFVDDIQIEKAVQQLGIVVRFHGLCGFDWVREERSGRIFVIELNPRPTPTIHAGVWTGVNFADAIRRLADGKVASRHLAKTKNEFVMFPEIAYSAIDNRNLGQFLRGLKTAPVDDPVLLSAISRRILTHYLRRAIRAWTR
jgi:glutathione synthase/RimK-type ligase-like ATP-grasp enzyme